MSYTDLITKENFGLYADIRPEPLTDEEKASTKYAQFYDFPITVPSEEKVLSLMPGNEVDLKDSMTPAECCKIFSPDPQPCENGFCVRPEGYGFSAVDVKLPNITMEMFMWFTKWYSSNPVNYKIWFPFFHVDATPGQLGIENLGWGDVYIDKFAGPPCTPETFGIANPKELDPDYIMMIGGGGEILELDGSDKEHPVYMTMINYFRRCGDGIENKVRAWMGMHYKDGEVILDQSDNPVSLYDRTRWMACHNAWEWSRVSTLLPEVFKYAKEIDDVTPPTPPGA